MKNKIEKPRKSEYTSKECDKAIDDMNAYYEPIIKELVDALQEVLIVSKLKGWMRGNNVTKVFIEKAISHAKEALKDE